ncbi:hypothetical protein FBZ98_104394 [Rhizobium sp. ERR 922]|uniref:hypothetical protein n=1 Tax=unclassified Rhizobium TaxID=2613769 RepID=UPI0011A937C2|nr:MULTISPECIES: hypothetical protein [unclassified Rhizobium]TWB53467.1 hypothetical protein FBZ98_104394 [Rhizobium sp. ERR 922]TWB95569.1 hypothetical protein FBZ97_104257 [Rhizobium sp. ERR 942]
MQIARMKRLNDTKSVLGAALVLAASFCQIATECRAETAYVAQIPVNVTTTVRLGNLPPQQQQYHSSSSHLAAGMAATPEAILVPRGNNLARTLEIGARNSVYHLQSGTGNSSTAGIIGNYGNINILQGGNNLESNVVLLNGAGLNVSVLQPAGSAPVNVLIARLPGGGLLIKR